MVHHTLSYTVIDSQRKTLSFNWGRKANEEMTMRRAENVRAESLIQGTPNNFYYLRSSVYYGPFHCV